MAVTIKDVAKAAGVSMASVSRALNGHSSVTPETRKRIEETAARLHYVPHSAARSLITRRTQTIGALLPDLHGPFFSELIRGIDLAARARGLHLLVSSSHGDAKEAASALQAMRGRVDGLLVMSPHADADFLKTNLPASLPSVLMNSVSGAGELATLSIDNAGGAAAMARHLIERGHRRIAFIGGPQNNVDAQQRWDGFSETLQQLAPEAEVFHLVGDFTEESGHRIGREALRHVPTAIFCANDMMAIGCLAAIHEAGLSVPQDVALAGFDDIPMARYLTPPLTTVRVPIVELGERALTQLALAVEKSGTPEATETVLSTELVVRASTETGIAAMPPNVGQDGLTSLAT